MSEKKNKTLQQRYVQFEKINNGYILYNYYSTCYSVYTINNMLCVLTSLIDTLVLVQVNRAKVKLTSGKIQVKQ